MKESRTQQVVDMTAKGLSRKEVAKKMGISPITVSTHLCKAKKMKKGTTRSYKKRVPKVVEIPTIPESGFVVIVSRDKSILEGLLSQVRL